MRGSAPATPRPRLSRSGAVFFGGWGVALRRMQHAPGHVTESTSSTCWPRRRRWDFPQESCRCTALTTMFTLPTPPCCSPRAARCPPARRRGTTSAPAGRSRRCSKPSASARSPHAAEPVGVHVLDHRQVIRASGRRYWPIVSRSQPWATRSASVGLELVVLLAQARA